MGHGDDRAGVLVEEPLEPLDRLGIEMVRRLVEQKKVGVLEEQPSERDTPLLAARQGRDVGIVGWATERLHRDLDVPLDVPRVGGVDPVLERALLGTDGLVVGIRLGPLRHDGVVRVEQALDLADAVHDVALDVLAWVELGLLAQEADGKSGREARFAGEAVVEPGHDPEETRLAGAVRADDADLGARVERDRDVLEDGSIRRVVTGELVGAVDEFGWHALKGIWRRGRRRKSVERPLTRAFLGRLAPRG